MGTSSSKRTEEVIIAQNGAGNSAATAQAENQGSAFVRQETYLLIIIACILGAILYVVWRYCKTGYARYLRRELQELPRIELRSAEPARSSSGGPSNHVIM
ncbi:hypothetical protein O3G_MSEX010587 [Manduca sexta]|uniref:Uncharacterized protein n=1 Tax=Manduca sexta TaxID=7130 RepID=A0A921ZHS2_MANSE|nr:hypothetical protein O3G_MSEX010587 [Manduca sexta]